MHSARRLIYFFDFDFKNNSMKCIWTLRPGPWWGSCLGSHEKHMLLELTILPDREPDKTFAFKCKVKHIKMKWYVHIHFKMLILTMILYLNVGGSILSPSYRWGIWSSQDQNDSQKIMWLVIWRYGNWIQMCALFSFSFFFSFLQKGSHKWCIGKYYM